MAHSNESNVCTPPPWVLISKVISYSLPQTSHMAMPRVTSVIGHEPVEGAFPNSGPGKRLLHRLPPVRLG